MEHTQANYLEYMKEWNELIKLVHGKVKELMKTSRPYEISYRDYDCKFTPKQIEELERYVQSRRDNSPGTKSSVSKL
jgi:hypothetical protein